MFIVLFVAVSSVLPYVIPGGGTHSFVRSVGPGLVTAQIRGNGSTNLDLYIYYNGVLIGGSESPGDYESVTVNTPGGNIGILVVNRGSYVNDYQANF